MRLRFNYQTNKYLISSLILFVFGILFFNIEFDILLFNQFFYILCPNIPTL